LEAHENFGVSDHKVWLLRQQLTWSL
jgi:hypothetical protein